MCGRMQRIAEETQVPEQTLQMGRKMGVSIYTNKNTCADELILLHAVDNPVKSRKIKIKLPWELSTIYSEYLGGPGGDDREEEDEDDIEAHADSLQRLKVSDALKSTLLRLLRLWKSWY
jgi:hypothetical protein